MDKLNNLHDKQNRLWNDTKELVERVAAEGRDFTADEKVTYDKLNAELDVTTENIERLKKFDTNAYEQAQKVEEQAERTKAPEYNEVFEKVMIVPHSMVALAFSSVVKEMFTDSLSEMFT